MKLKEFRVREFRSVWDSGRIIADDVTCLVGKNEAGKTGLLKALYRLNPIIEADSKFNVTDDYPRKEVGDYKYDIEANRRAPATVIQATFEMNEAEAQAVIGVFGERCLKSRMLELNKNYENIRHYVLDFDEAAAMAHLSEQYNLLDSVRDELRTQTTWPSFIEVLDKSETTSDITKLRALVSEFSNQSASWHSYNNILKKFIPSFLYFDEYYQLAGHENIPALIERQATGSLKPQDYPLIGLINLARLKLTELLNTQRTVELTNTLEGAGNHLSRQILRYWSQNKHLQMKFDVREAKPDDPEHMRSGVNIWGKVYDSVHWATTELSSRSRGFVWFFSFLAWYEDVKRQGKNVILLLDEPALSLHGKAQADLLRYIEQELQPHHQIIYTTHSPFMVDANHFERVRIVQDKSIDSNEPLPKEQDGTKVLTDVFDASEDSLFPLQGALGYELHQTLFVGPNCLVVEGPEDMLFIKGMSSILEREGGIALSPLWTITPVGGSSKVPTFVALLAPQKGMKIATLLDIQAKDVQSIEGLYKKRLLEKKNVVTYADFVASSDADVADMFDRAFYISLVNQEYADVLQNPLEISDLNVHLPRVIKAIEAVLFGAPLKGTSINSRFLQAARFIGV